MIIFGNNLGPNGTVALAKPISKMLKMNYIHAAYNNMRDDAVVVLVSSIYNRRDVSLDLRFNKIGPSGGFRLAQLFKTMSVKGIQLGDNELRDDASLEIARAFIHDPLPTGVFMENNGNNETTRSELRRIMVNVSSISV